MSLLARWVIATVLLAAWMPPARSGTVRVRKELRKLTHTEVKLLVQGISTMLTVDTSTGQKLYGAAYKEYSYFIVKHAVAYLDPRGDQGHNDVCFMTFHRAWLLEFERALLSVVPGLKAIPYWNLLHDLRGGKYKNGTQDHIFSPKWGGSRDGDAAYNYTVTDGLFSWHPVPSFNWAKWGQAFGWVYNGSLTTGLLRSPTNTNKNPYLTRYPTVWSDKKIRAMSDGKYALYPTYAANELPLNFTSRDFNLCTDPAHVAQWADWTLCVDSTAMAYAGYNNSHIEALMSKSTSALFHGVVHRLLGSESLQGESGDMTDVGTSPNEIFIFPAHHANVDRSNMMWQINAAKVNSTMATKNLMWGYPTSKATWPTGSPGCFLHDVVTSNFPFTDIFPGVKPSNPRGYTHFDVLWNTRPGISAPYTYDYMQPESTPLAA